MPEADCMGSNIYVNGIPLRIGDSMYTSNEGDIPHPVEYRMPIRRRRKPIAAVEKREQEDSAGLDISLSEKCLLTLDEAAKYTGIGVNKLREISNGDDCDFILWNGSRRMFKKEKLKNYLYGAYSI